RAKRSLRAASLGSSSVKRTPAVRVGMVAKGPRYSAGALGLGSKVSRWLGAPQSQSRSTDLARTAPYRALSSARLEVLRANGASSPARKNARRLMPWQTRAGKLPMSTIVRFPEALTTTNYPDSSVAGQRSNFKRLRPLEAGPLPEAGPVASEVLGRGSEG